MSPTENGVSEDNAAAETGQPPPAPLIVVGIGSSAGGLEALKALLPHLPNNDRLTYIVAQHLDPKHRSMLVPLLTRDSYMEVLEAKDGEKLLPAKIYITPPNNEVTIEGSALRLNRPSYNIGPKPSIDLLFTSIAEDAGENCVGIILSGTGSDGAHGIRAIKAAGGLTIVQEEATAKYNGMPHAAIETECVDLVLSPEKIGPELAKILQFPHERSIVKQAEKSPNALERLFQLLLKKSGSDFSEYKDSTIQRRIERRMFANRIEKLEDYVALMENSPKEIDLLFKDILISVTSFFREPEAFGAVSGLIPRIMEHKKEGDSIRIWVPGCATGEEVYSLTILLAERLGDAINRYNIQIFGTDIDTEATMRARRGIYPEAALEKVDQEILNRYFIRRGNSFQVVKSIRDMVVFAKHDLIKDPPFSHVDLISCRNLLIYFNASLQKRVISIFHYVLNPGGYLFLGKSETVGDANDIFATIDRRHKIYRKMGQSPHVSLQFTRNIHYRPRRLDQNVMERRKETTLEEMLLQTLVKVFAPPSVIVNDRQDILHIHGDITPFIRFSPGEANLNILKLAFEPLRVELRALVHKAAREQQPVRGKVHAVPGADRERLVRAMVAPVESADLNGLLLVSFEEIAPVVRETTHGEDDYGRVLELEQELAANREHLQTVIEELETSNEELQSLNEELQASNEELQSTNEELETSNEELQSTNEELITVNEELQVKSSELVAANADLENIMNNIGFGVIVVDRDLRVKRFNLAATRVFALMPDDLGQVITSVRCSLPLPELRQTVNEVVTTGRSQSEQVEAEDRIFLMNIAPCYSELKKVIGAVITFIDQTEMHSVERKLRRQEEGMAFAERAANFASWEWDVATSQFAASPQFDLILGRDADRPCRTFVSFLESVFPEDRDVVLHAFTDSVRSGKECRIEHRIVGDAGVRWVKEVAQVISGSDGDAAKLAGIIWDIDELRHAGDAAVRRENAGA